MELYLHIPPTRINTCKKRERKNVFFFLLILCKELSEKKNEILIDVFFLWKFDKK